MGREGKAGSTHLHRCGPRGPEAGAAAEEGAGERQHGVHQRKKNRRADSCMQETEVESTRTRAWEGGRTGDRGVLSATTGVAVAVVERWGRRHTTRARGDGGGPGVGRLAAAAAHTTGKGGRGEAGWLAGPHTTGKVG